MRSGGRSATVWHDNLTTGELRRTLREIPERKPLTLKK